MDPNIQNDLLNIALSILGNGLTSLIAKSSHKIEELVVGKNFLAKQQHEKTALQPILQQAISLVAEHANWNASKGEVYWP